MNKEIDEHIQNLGGIEPLGNVISPVTEKELASIETALGTELPEDYRDFLRKFGACTFGELVEFRLIGGSPLFVAEGAKVQTIKTGPLSHFYGSSSGNQSLNKRILTYRDRIPRTMIPVADDGGGNQICIGIGGNEQGKVYYWDHENEPLDEDEYLEEYGENRPSELIFQNVYPIAESFEDFLRCLKVKRV